MLNFSHDRQVRKKISLAAILRIKKLGNVVLLIHFGHSLEIPPSPHSRQCSTAPSSPPSRAVVFMWIEFPLNVLTQQRGPLPVI